VKSLLEYRNVLFDSVADSMEEVLILIDTDLRVTYMNKAAQTTIGVLGDEYLGRHFFDELGVWVIHGDRNHTTVHEVLETRIPQMGARYLSMWFRCLSIPTCGAC